MRTEAASRRQQAPAIFFLGQSPRSHQTVAARFSVGIPRAAGVDMQPNVCARRGSAIGVFAARARRWARCSCWCRRGPPTPRSVAPAAERRHGSVLDRRRSGAGRAGAADDAGASASSPRRHDEPGGARLHAATTPASSSNAAALQQHLTSLEHAFSTTDAALVSLDKYRFDVAGNAYVTLRASPASVTVDPNPLKTAAIGAAVGEHPGAPTPAHRMES